MKKYVKNIQAVLIIGTIIKILGLIYKIIITRILGIEGMRLFSLITPTLSLALCLSSLSIPTVVNQNVASNLIQKKTRVATIMKAALKITFVSSNIISIILLCSFPFYKTIYQNPFIYYPLLICIPLIYISNCTGILRGYLEANNHFQMTYLANLFEQIAKISISFIILFFLKDKNIEIQVFSCFFAMMLSEFASFFYLAFKIQNKRKINYIKISTNGYEKSILKQAFPLTLDQLCITLTNYIQPFVFYYVAAKNNISFLESTTYYAQVTTFAIPLLIFAYFGCQSIAKFSFPQITKYQQNRLKLEATLSKAFFFSFLIAAFNFILCYFYAEESLLFLFNDTSSSQIVHLLSPLYFFMYFNPIFITILQSYKKEKKLLLATIISSILSIILIVLFTINPKYNLTGFIIGLSIGNLVKFIILFILANKEIKYKPKKEILISLILLLVIYFLLNLFLHNIFYFIFTTLLSSGIALLIYYYFYKNNEFPYFRRKHTKLLK